MRSISLAADGLAAALRFLPTAWSRAWGAIVIATGLLAWLFAHRLAAPLSPWPLEILVPALLAMVVVQGALYRVALGVGRPGPAGLQWGPPESRLAAVWGLTTVFMAILGMLAFVVLLAFAFAVASAGHGFVVARIATWAAAVDARGRVVVGCVSLFAAVGLTWAAARVAFASAASVYEGRLQVLASWPLTRGRTLPVIIGRLLIGLGVAGVAAVALGLLSGAGRTSPVGVWSAALAIAVVIGGLWLPLGAGLMAYLYKQNSLANLPNR